MGFLGFFRYRRFFTPSNVSLDHCVHFCLRTVQFLNNCSFCFYDVFQKRDTFTFFFSLFFSHLSLSFFTFLSCSLLPPLRVVLLETGTKKSQRFDRLIPTIFSPPVISPGANSDFTLFWLRSTKSNSLRSRVIQIRWAKNEKKKNLVSQRRPDGEVLVATSHQFTLVLRSS